MWSRMPAEGALYIPGVAGRGPLDAGFFNVCRSGRVGVACEAWVLIGDTVRRRGIEPGEGQRRIPARNTLGTLACTRNGRGR